MSVALVPIPFFQVIQDGIPVSGAKIFTYESGTTTKLNSFTTAAGDVPNTNPVIADAQGRAVIYLTDGLLYTLVVAPANDTDPPSNPYGTYPSLYGNSVLPLPYADAGGTADVITASYLVNSPTLVDGYTLLLDIGTTNATTTPTFAPTLNGVLQTARTIKKSVGNANVALAVGDLQGVAMLVYDLTNLVWILQNPALWPTATTATNQSGGTVAATTISASGNIVGSARVSGAGTTGTNTLSAVVGNASSSSGTGVYGVSSTGDGIHGFSASGYGIRGSSNDGIGIQAISNNGVKAPFSIQSLASAPTGPNSVGDMYVTAAGVLKICTVAGSPGTWVSVGAQT